VIIPVILCGGLGSRLWPLSRPDEPKPFLPLVDGRSTFAMTLDRVGRNPQFGPVVVMANVQQRHAVNQALAAANVNATVLLEPEPRGTAPAVAAAAAFVASADPFATLLILPADQIIRDITAFVATVTAAAPVADSGRIVVFGVSPQTPTAGCAYVRPGEPFTNRFARSVEGYVETPERDEVSGMIADGWLWSTGVFLMRAATAQAELGFHASDIVAAARSAVSQGTGSGNALILARDSFVTAPIASFGHAVMEKTDLGAVVASRFDWANVATWEGAFAAAGKDAAGNAVSGDAVVVDTHDSYVSTTHQKVGVVGMRGVVVVAGDDAILVTTRDQAATIHSFEAAVAGGPERNLGDFQRHYRPWGHYQTLALGGRYQAKRIVVAPGHRLSLQVHAHRAERWTIVEGSAEVTIGKDMKTLKTVAVGENQAVDIPRGTIHRLANRGQQSLVIIEVQTGDYLGEDDIVRLEDDYGR
jgi:mannose-1-phosphate guanylyltransferase/mannose-6-phosphate isomerase